MAFKPKYNLRLSVSAAGYLFIIISLITNTGCKKIVRIPEPINSVTTSSAFSSDANATSAILAIYSNMSFADNNSYFGNGGMSVYAGLSADELISTIANPDYVQLQTNKLLATNSIPGGNFWKPAYFDIYMANAAIEGLQQSKSITEATKAQLMGEAKFLRAFCYFYLTNLFGDVPLTLTSDWNKTMLMTRTPQDQVYQQIVQDLKDAKQLLVDNYSLFQGERSRVNKWAAISLLARVYLYSGDWMDAETEASLVISNSSTYSLLSDLTKVFLKNSNEAIWQLQTLDRATYATQEGFVFLPDYFTRNFPPSVVAQYWQFFVPNFYLSDQLVNAFETGDQRIYTWADSTGQLNGKNYYFPFKYKIKKSTAGNVTEYNTILRLSEQYLIRSEARAKQNKLSESINDLNIIRNRAGLPNLSSSLTQAQLLTAIAQENRVEFFAEWGHRWLDLKRTQQSSSILGAISTKQPWSSKQLLYPIPVSEIQRDPNLTQNEGY